MPGIRRSTKLRAIAASEAKLGLDTVIRLRWGAAACQMAAILVAVTVFTMHLPTGLLVALISVTAVTNLLLTRSRYRAIAPPSLVGGILLLDTAVLTALLLAAGGAENPFSVLYLVHVTLAAVVLGERWTWFITAVSALAYASLFFAPGRSHSMHHAAEGFSAHLQGMWIAFTVAACTIAYFV